MYTDLSNVILILSKSTGGLSIIVILQIRFLEFIYKHERDLDLYLFKDRILGVFSPFPSYLVPLFQVVVPLRNLSCDSEFVLQQN